MPVTDEEFDHLRTLTVEALELVGLVRWDESGLMLLPCEWYPLIPLGFEVVTINGEAKTFGPGMSPDARFGVLSFGLIPAPAA